MKLSIGSQPIALPLDVNISIEKTSPVLNDAATSFSYPFPIPTRPNQQVLGWPGKLERIFTLPENTFILEDKGIQVLTGEIEYDEVDENEIGIILKSGMTEFWAKNEGISLTELDYGSEWWFEDDTTYEALIAKFTEWDTANITAEAPFVVAPFIMNNYDNTGTMRGNKWKSTSGTGTLTNFISDFVAEGSGYYQLQFKAWFILEKIFENSGFTVVDDELKDSEFEKLVVFGKPFIIYAEEAENNVLRVLPISALLTYAKLMPTIDVIDFLDAIKELMGLMFDINDATKEVRITVISSLFQPESLDTMVIPELKGWKHKEGKFIPDGFSLQYQSQDNENDTRSDYATSLEVSTTLPAPTYEGTIIKVLTPLRYFITVKKSDDSLVWEEIGRLKPYISGNGKETKELPVVVPRQVLSSLVERPMLNITPNTFIDRNIIELTELIVSLYHGLVAFDTITVPYLCGDQYSMDQNMNPDETSLFTWAIKDNGISLSPDYLYNAFYADFLTWQSYYRRSFTKYIQLTLPQLLSLQWNKRYMISGIRVILDKINYELPFTGIVKVEGFTA